MNTKTLHTKTERQLVPQLRFAEFKDGWQVIKFDKYCRFQQGVQVDVDLQKTEPFEDYIRFLRIENYTQASDDFRFIPNVYQKSKIIDESDIVVVRYGATAGYIGRGFNGVLANNLFKIIPDSNFFDKNYLFQYLNSYRAFHFFQTEMSGGAMPALSFGIVKALKVPLTAVPEQQKIASFLTSVDVKLQQLTQKKELLEQYKKGVMQQLFSQQLRFKLPDGSNYPDWEFHHANILFKSISDKNHNSDLPILAISQEFGAVPRELINYKISVENTSVAGYKVVQKGDFIISLRSFQGGIEYSNYQGICSPAYNILRPTSDNIVHGFYKRYLKTEYYIRQLQRKLEGIRDGKMISYKYFSEIKLPFPCKKEQQHIANYLSGLDMKIEIVAQQITQAQQFKKGLLQQMFVAA